MSLIYCANLQNNGMKAKKGKFIAFFLIINLIVLPGNLDARKCGVKLIITQKNREQTEGELIAIKQNSLLLLAEDGKDVSFDIRDIEFIKVEKKSKFINSIRNGLLIGAGIGFVIGIPAAVGDSSCFSGPEMLYTGPLIGTIYGVIIGGLAGVFSDKYKIIRMEGKSPEEIESILKKLQKKARIPDYR